MTLIGFICVLVFIVLGIYSKHLQNSLPDQQFAKRWTKDSGVAQISCFVSENASLDPDKIVNFEHTLDQLLLEASITSENPLARLWVDSYSASGEITLVVNKTSVTAKAIGIGGDFFLFHPLQLVEGSYFSGNDIMKDYVIIDEDMAWQLFGSNNVVGLTVNINNFPHIVSGVIRRDSGRIKEAAGLDTSTVYVSYETLKKYGQGSNINSYEILMPNPIKGFAYQMIKENIGIDEKLINVVENSKRFSFISMLKVLSSFGTRSMSTQNIIFPYWENAARGMEDIVALLLLLQSIVMILPVVMIVIFIIKKWKQKTWSIKDILKFLNDKWYEFLCRRANKNNQNKPKKEKIKKAKVKKGEINYDEKDI